MYLDHMSYVNICHMYMNMYEYVYVVYLHVYVYVSVGLKHQQSEAQISAIIPSLSTHQ